MVPAVAGRHGLQIWGGSLNWAMRRGRLCPLLTVPASLSLRLTVEGFCSATYRPTVVVQAAYQRMSVTEDSA